MAGFIAPIIGGLAGLFGGGVQKKTQTSGTIDTTNSQNQTTSGTSTNTPNLSPYQTTLANLFTQGLASNYNNATNLSGYTQGGLENINAGANASQNIINNQLAASGQSFSPAAQTAKTQAQLSRVSQGNTFLSQVPLLQQQLKQQALGQLVAGFSALPTGSTSTGTQSTSGTSTSDQTQQGTNLVSGNPTAGAISGLGAGLFAPSGPSGQTNLSSILSMFGGGGNPAPLNPYGAQGSAD
jgi:hypothetical protein